ncbi:MAG: biotin/lipoyl-binding protein [Clostridia bacterium]|nr:biotin/lipoyl-binding protein [Clostridia bacterium]
MRRRLGMVCMLLATAALAAGIAVSGMGADAAAVQARLVQVTRGDVVVTAALTGRIAYAQETPAMAVYPGLVAEVYVEPGQRVAAGQALLRVDIPGAQQAAAAFAAHAPAGEAAQHLQTLLQSAIVRAPQDAVVRQVLVQENAMVGMGDVVAVLSGSEQVIVCAASQKDAGRLERGQSAVIMADGEVLGHAAVEGVGALSADPATGRLVCEVTLTPAEPLPVPQGAAVEVDVILEERRDVPVLPVEAVTPRGTLWWVHDGICTEIRAEIVLSDEMYAMVPLAEGTAVAIGEFTEGQRIREERP